MVLRREQRQLPWAIVVSLVFCYCATSISVVGGFYSPIQSSSARRLVVLTSRGPSSWLWRRIHRQERQRSKQPFPLDESFSEPILHSPSQIFALRTTSDNEKVAGNEFFLSSSSSSSSAFSASSSSSSSSRLTSSRFTSSGQINGSQTGGSRSSNDNNDKFRSRENPMFFLSQDYNSHTMTATGAGAGATSGAPGIKQHELPNGHSPNSPQNRNPPSPMKGTLNKRSSTIAGPSQNNSGPSRDKEQETSKDEPPDDDDSDNMNTNIEPVSSLTLTRSLQQEDKDVFDAQKGTKDSENHTQIKKQPLQLYGSSLFSNDEKAQFFDDENDTATDSSTKLEQPVLSETNDFSSRERQASLLWTNSSKGGSEEERFSGLRLENALPSVSRLFGFFSKGDKNIDDDKDGSRNSWRRRHARSLEEGIRFERKGSGVTELSELSSLLDRAELDYTQVEGRRFIERTLMGLINALAGEVEDLDVTVDGKSDTPFWRKEVNEVRINFSRLGFKPLQMGGCDVVPQKKSSASRSVTSVQDKSEVALDLSLVQSADEAFDRIDVDNSGALDSGEIASALAIVSELGSDQVSMEELATELVEMYDTNGDGVVDREEYQRMVEDMAALQKARLEQRSQSEKENSKENGPLSGLKKSVQTLSQDIKNKAVEVADGMKSIAGGDETAAKPEKMFGSITLSDLKLDLRRVVFGGIPLLKRITPGGPLILEPFTMTIKGSFNREDVMGSFLLDAGLRLLVARALRVRVRTFRDFVDGAYFFGRQWKMSSKSAPAVEVLGLSNVEFDKKDRMILTGRARLRTSPEAPVVTNTFKVRTKIGTRKGGQAIRLVEPELAFVFECPQSFEQGAKIVSEALKLPVPERPAPIYSFFPIYSPFKVNDNAGFDMGEDNLLRSICIKDGALQFEMRAVLRPGRFLGNHYLAFTLPMRTFIITTDRVKEGIRSARRNKKIAVLEKKLEAGRQAQAFQVTDNEKLDDGIALAETNRVSNFASLDELRRHLFAPRPKGGRKNRAKLKSFFSRFVEGYTLMERDGDTKNERLTTAISDWFGRQGSANSTVSSLNRPTGKTTISS